MTKTNLTVQPKFVSVQITVCIQQENSRWNTVYGQNSFDVTLPFDAMGALDIAKLMPSIVEQAKLDFAVKVAEDVAAKAKEALEHGTLEVEL